MERHEKPKSERYVCLCLLRFLEVFWCFTSLFFVGEHKRPMLKRFKLTLLLGRFWDWRFFTFFGEGLVFVFVFLVMAKKPPEENVMLFQRNTCICIFSRLVVNVLFQFVFFSFRLNSTKCKTMQHANQDALILIPHPITACWPS